jgi:Zn-dependent protease
MLPTRSGSLRLFEFSGVEVFLHWSWFVVGAYEINTRSAAYSSLGWNVLEYLSLFLIVLLHEFGHSLACRQVGGQASQIVLWPLGGIAFVAPPPRPGATLWSIAAGPLVNVLLTPILFATYWMMRAAGWEDSHPDAFKWISAVVFINTALLVFNLLPVYPLDGGQILRSLLWFVLGRSGSLMVATGIGFLGGLGLVGLAIRMGSPWIVLMAAFLLWQCWNSFKQAQHLAGLESAPRRSGFVCPRCQAVPPVGEFWVCGECRRPFDTFATGAVCPGCSTAFPNTMCVECGTASPMHEWTSAGRTDSAFAPE